MSVTAFEKLLWFFTKEGFKGDLVKHDKETLEGFQKQAIAKEEYELAAYIEYYLQFKYEHNYKAAEDKNIYYHRE